MSEASPKPAAATEVATPTSSLPADFDAVALPLSSPLRRETLVQAEAGAPNDIALIGGLIARCDGHIIELTRYSQSGKVKLEGDTVTQQIGKGRTSEYSLSQFAVHSKDPQYFENTVRYAAKHGNSVNFSVHEGVSFVEDRTLERRLPQQFPYRDIILRAAVRHDVDPAVLAAVGQQESGMGSGASYNTVSHLSADGHGHGVWQMDDRYNPLADCLRAGRDPQFAADEAARKLAKGIANQGLARGIQSYNGTDLELPYYHLVMGPPVSR